MNPVKPVLVLAALMAVGLMFLAYNHRTPAAASSHFGMMRNHHELIENAQELCTTVIKAKLHTAVAKPSLIRSDDVRFVDLIWDAGYKQPGQIVCHYESDKGVADLVLDGKSLGPVSVDLSENPAAHARGSLAGKHGEH